MSTLGTNTLTLIAILALCALANAEPRKVEGSNGLHVMVVADSTDVKRDSRRQTRSVFSLGPNVPEDPPGDEVASRTGKPAETGAAAGSTAGTSGDGRASGTSPATRGLRAR